MALNCNIVEIIENYLKQVRMSDFDGSFEDKRARPKEYKADG